MKVSYFAFMATAMWACCGCSSEKSGDKPVADAKIGIRTSILDRSEMRTPSLDSNGSGSFADGDHFSLLVSDGADGLLDFDYETGATQLYWKDVTFASSPEKVHFAACYPKRDLSGAQFTFDLETEADKDLLLARTADVPAGTTAPVDLTFRHAMHRLVVTFTDDSDVDTESVQTVCTARSACTVDLLDGSLKTDEGRKASFSARGKSVFFLLVPQKTSDVEFELRFDDQTCRVLLSDYAGSHDELLGGMQLHVELTLKEGRVEIGKTTIEGWGDQGTVEGEIIL